MAAYLVVPLLVAGFGCALLVGTVKRMHDTSVFGGRGVHAIGTIVARDGQPGPPRTSAIVVRFTAADGSRRIFRESGDGRVGDTVRVLYDPQDPGRATTRSPAYRWVMTGVLMVVCAVVILVGGGIFVVLGRDVLREVRQRDRRTARSGS
ncbi:DUF3592 domain-containing protein [Actinomadura graeca]|uniref:DUF3592 domain-containing protein n=1 Tax=Actinomadura graeca TaxID=2750812 RepID=A0ABX8R0C9_9ACTN|nr:DUF3592 domain-containing protein [Actinomadura graeca]QXJ24524.1 DUF3592 domain-containing protein [Actinomadura graeca]